ncbi:hypothetical protein [Campylobacter concisus]|nr:hypothetical protein [Campylobacter concisus]
MSLDLKLIIKASLIKLPSNGKKVVMAMLPVLVITWEFYTRMPKA